MRELIHAMFPEIVLCAAACGLFARRIASGGRAAPAPVFALLALAIALVSQFSRFSGRASLADNMHTVQVYEFGRISSCCRR